MNTMTKSLLILSIFFLQGKINAQELKKDSITEQRISNKIEYLNQSKKLVEIEERKFLKAEIEAINKKLDKGIITAEEAEILKKEAAKKRAANIENRLAIIDNKIALTKRNDFSFKERDSIQFGIFKVSGPRLRAKNTSRDIRTKSDVIFAIGFNNATIQGQSLDDSPYKIGGSGFVELGYAWKTRIFENTNFWRVNYGVSIQWNKLNIKDNNYLVNTDGNITLEEFPIELNKAKFRTTNLVFPVHLEFGPSRKIEKENYFRYSTHNKFKLGLGGYAGLNIGSMQKLKYKEDGERVKDKQRGDFEVSNFVYGLSGYLAWGSVALYAKYDLNTLFKNQAIDQNNISLGIRFNVD